MAKKKRIPRYLTTSRIAYDKFIKEHSSINITYNQWKKVIYTFNYKLATYILETGERVKINPIGSFAISRKTTQRFVEVDGQQFVKLPIDWPKTLKAGKRVYLLNTHSDGFRYWCQWFEVDARFGLSSVWGFKLSRINSRRLAQYIKNNDSDFRERYREWGEVSTLKRSRI